MPRVIELPAPGTSTTVKGDWWVGDKTKTHEKSVALARFLESENAHRHNANEIYYGLYSGASIKSLFGAGYARRKRRGDRIQVNICNSLVNTITSKIGKNKVRVVHLTEGGDFSQRERGRKLTKLTNGAFWQMKLFEHQRNAFRDSCIFDFGAVKFFKRGGKVRCERTFPNEFRVDEVDALHGNPRSLHQVRPVPRDVLLKLDEQMGWGKNRQIKDAPQYSDEFNPQRWTADMVEVTESWHLPSDDGKDAKKTDGMHAICIDNATLFVEPWTHPWFPFVFHRFDPMPLGWHGQGLIAQIVGIQNEIKKTIHTISEHMAFAVGYMAVDSASAINTDTLGINEIGRIIEYTSEGRGAQWVSADPISRQYFDYLDYLVQQAYEIVGVSQLSATGRKPAGLDAAVAIREQQDVETERFATIAQSYEESYLQASEITLAFMEEIAEEQGGLRVSYPESNRAMRTIDWEQARMDREDYTTRVVPSGFLPSTPSAKMATVTEMAQNGFIGPQEAKMLLDYPDLEAANEQSLAPIRNIDRRIELIMDTDDPGGPLADVRPPWVPSEYINAELAIERARNAYENAEINGAPDENLELLAQFIQNCEELIQKQMEAQAPTAPPVGAPTPEPPIEAAPVAPL